MPEISRQQQEGIAKDTHQGPLQKMIIGFAARVRDNLCNHWRKWILDNPWNELFDFEAWGYNRYSLSRYSFGLRYPLIYVPRKEFTWKR